MSNRPPDERDIPDSPNELRGPIGGVTRIGPRAFGLAFFVICALLVAILYGLNRGSSYSKGPQVDAFNTPPPAIPTGESRFGANEPLIASAPPATAPAPLLLPTASSVPDLDAENAKQNSNSTNSQEAARANQEAMEEQQREARRRAEEQQARDEAEKKRRELLLAALKSPILTGDKKDGGLAFAGNGGGDSSDGSASFASYNGGGESGGGSGGQASSAIVRGDQTPQDRATANPNAFLDGPNGQFATQPNNVKLPQGANPKDFLQAQRFAPRSPFEITAGSVLPASLITSIDTDVAGLMTAQVREDVYDTKTGRYLLVPKGSRLVGLYKNQISAGQTRLLVAWQRLIFPDTSSIDLLDMNGFDVEGNAGISGTVDNHYGAIFGAAILTSVLAAGVSISSGQQTSVLGAPSASQQVSSAVGQQIAQTGTQILQRQINIPPSLHIPKGYPFIVIVDHDMVLPGPYRSQR